jgi:hypothetical protein
MQFSTLTPMVKAGYIELELKDHGQVSDTQNETDELKEARFSLTTLGVLHRCNYH